MRTAFRVASVVLGIPATGYAYCLYRNRTGHPIDCRPIMKTLALCIDPEHGHQIAIWALKQSRVIREALLLVDHSAPEPNLKTRVWGIDFDNPIGFAAGFDKNAEAIAGVLEMGVGFVEIGSVTGDPQAGNPRPRVFRYAQTESVVNRYGFNSDGHQAVRRRLSRLPERLPGVVGVNLGRNKFATEFDYVKGARILGPYADYLTINVSSPNTPGLRGLQNKKELAELIRSVHEVHRSLPASSRTQAPIPLLLKIAPDLTDEELMDIATVALQSNIDGIIISNTTVWRPDTHEYESGGLSGRPLLEKSTQCLRRMYQLTKGKIPLIGVGGISSGYDAYQKIRSGSSLVQVYSSFVFQGPSLIPRIKRELSDCLKRDGYGSVAEAIGADVPL